MNKTRNFDILRCMQALSHFFSDLAISARWLKDGGLSDLKSFKAETGLTWTDTAGREFSLAGKEYVDWRGNRADAGRLAPKGFPCTNRFSAMVAESRRGDLTDL